ncbi:MAG TPA: ATP-binding cassette domain-containing protein [Candidatus Onthovivens sp.]|nr:ATP-binding cassette domain-containing protein [Candidatus Onthovivens sp.]
MIKIENISKILKNGDGFFSALDNISVEIPKNKITIISGSSGSGKSTLLSIIGLLQAPSSGKIVINDYEVNYRKPASLKKYINQNISYVFQEFNLIEDFNVVDNLLMVCNDLELVNEILLMIGLLNKKQTPTKLLSGGEKQRLAIGRAIAKSGEFILLDEPTGNLDEKNGQIIFELLKHFSVNKTIVVVTHDMKLASNYADFVILLNSGRISSSFKMTQNTFRVNLKDQNIDAFLSILEVLKYKLLESPIKLKVKSDNKEKDYLINLNNLLSILNEIYTDFNKYEITITLEEKQDLENTSNDLLMTTKDKRHIFSLRFVFKYSAKLFKNKFWRNIFSVLLLVLNMLMIFVYANIATFDYVGATNNGLIRNDAFFAEPIIDEVNEITSEPIRYRSGKNLYSFFDDKDVKPLSVFKTTPENVRFLFSFVVIDQPLNYRGTLINPPKEDNVIVSEFISAIHDQETIEIDTFREFGLNFNYSLTIERTVPCNLDPNDVQLYLNDNLYQQQNGDKFIGDYSLAFISDDTFSKMKNQNSHFIYGSNFFYSKLSLSEYANHSLTYQLYQDEPLLFGVVPQKINEIVIAKNFFEKYKHLTDFTEVEECLGREFLYRDFNSSPNRDLYQEKLNIYDVVSKVKVVGVVEDPAEDVFTAFAFNESLNKERNYFLSSYLVEALAYRDHFKVLLDDGIFFNLTYLNPILSMKLLVNSQFMYIILSAIIIMLVSTITFLCLTFIANVRSKYKEIAILKSFGTSKRNIYGLFFILNYFIAFVSMLIGLGLSTLALHFVNLVFMTKEIFNIDYILVIATPYSFILILSVPLIVALISTLIALHRVNRIDIALALKMF